MSDVAVPVGRIAEIVDRRADDFEAQWYAFGRFVWDGLVLGCSTCQTWADMLDEVE
jgi:hypothetical protein